MNNLAVMVPLLVSFLSISSMRDSRRVLDASKSLREDDTSDAILARVRGFSLAAMGLSTELKRMKRLLVGSVRRLAGSDTKL